MSLQTQAACRAAWGACTHTSDMLCAHACADTHWSTLLSPSSDSNCTFLYNGIYVYETIPEYSQFVRRLTPS